MTVAAFKEIEAGLKEALAFARGEPVPGTRIHGRPLRYDLTPQEMFRLKEYGSIHFESAGATRKR